MKSPLLKNIMNIDKIRNVKIRSLSLLNTASIAVVSVMVALLPLFFIPSQVFSFTFDKVLLLALGVILPALFWLISRLIDGKVEIPKGYLFVSALLVPLMYFLASLFSDATKVSLVGRGYEIDTFIFILLLFLLFFVVVFFFKENRAIKKLYYALIIPFVIITLFHLLRFIFGADFLTFGGLFREQVNNFLGKWNDLGIFFGLISILSLTGLEVLKPKRLQKILLYSSLFLSLLFLILINFQPIWVILGLVSIFFFVYKVLFRDPENLSESTSEWRFSKLFTAPSLIVFVLALVLIMFSGIWSGFISEKLQISQLEVRPSWSSTMDIGVNVIKSSPLLGAGPNRFSVEWFKNKPDGINNTIFWNTEFDSGIGNIPSTLTTVGLLGLLSWIVFIFLFILYGIGGVLNTVREKSDSRYLTLSSFLASIYLWIFTVIYIPNVVILALTFIFSGIFISTQIASGRINVIRLSFVQNPKVGFVSAFGSVVIIIGVIFMGYVYITKYVSFHNFRQALVAFNVNGDIKNAEQELINAIDISENDLFYRSLAQLDILKINQIISQKDLPEEEARTQFQNALGSAITHAKKATEYDSKNYQNWVILGDIYSTIVPVGVEGAYEGAISAYNQALVLDPHDPGLYLVFARLEASKDNAGSARDYIAKSLKEKSNYSQAVFFLSQLEASLGNLDEAVKSAESASILAPDDATAFFQLGILKYNQEKFADAIIPLERAVVLLPDYSNAKYFLGISYYKVGKNDDAITQFKEIEILNPDNAEVKLILANLENGDGPFEGAEPPVDSSPETRDELPITEKAPVE